jgi:hypothetical protein
MGQAECIAVAVAAIQAERIAAAIAAGVSPGRRLHQRKDGTGAQQRCPPSNARVAPVIARQTNHSAPFAPAGDATRPKSSADRHSEAKFGKQSKRIR